MKTSFLKFGIIFRSVAFILLSAGVKYTIYATAPDNSMYLVWSDEFEGTEIDTTYWNFRSGAEYAVLHYYTDRPENITVQGGYLYHTARKENYMGRNYTSAGILTNQKLYWKYGRFEARVKLPSTPNLVAAFWMVHEEGKYGWWPESGEIDIFEVFTGNVNRIYGNIGTSVYNHIFGSEIAQGYIDIDHASDEFHVYALEWNDDSISFFVDDALFYTFQNENTGFENWPFDQPFHILMTLAVVDEFEEESGEMITDYIRVYQKFEDVGISGENCVYKHTIQDYQGPVIEGASYTWSVPEEVQLLSGQETDRIQVKWNKTGGNIDLTVSSNENVNEIMYPVSVSDNLLRNSGFEKGTKYWEVGSGSGYARFFLKNDCMPLDNNCVEVIISELGYYPFDIMIRQIDVPLEAGNEYEGIFWARSEDSGNEMDIVFINSEEPYNVVYSKHYTLTEEWKEYGFSFVPSQDYKVIFKLDIGYQIGTLYFDNLSLIMKDGSGIEDDFGSSPPSRFFFLDQNYPNPFNSVTEIMYFLPKSCHVSLAIYSILGQKMIVLVDEQQTAGYKRVCWDGRNLKGKEVTSGIYFYKIQTGEYTETKMMVFLR